MSNQAHVVGAVQGLVAFSKFIDASQEVDEAQTFARVAKVAEQAGEALGDLIREQGRNVLKEDGERTIQDVASRVLGVAFCALATYEHLTDHSGNALPDLFDMIQRMDPEELRHTWQ